MCSYKLLYTCSSATQETDIDSISIGKKTGDIQIAENKINATSKTTVSLQIEQESDEDKDYDKFLTGLAKGFTLSLAYAANVGGVGTSTGTTPNIVMKGFADG